jgi:antirestriction protein ArdC
VVFNAEQLDGLPALAPKAAPWDRHDRAEALLKASGADIRHDQADRACYRPALDRIHLPVRDTFKSADAYYATALHEVGHYAGIRIMPSRCPQPCQVRGYGPAHRHNQSPSRNASS